MEAKRCANLDTRVMIAGPLAQEHPTNFNWTRTNLLNLVYTIKVQIFLKITGNPFAPMKTNKDICLSLLTHEIEICHSPGCGDKMLMLWKAKRKVTLGHHVNMIYKRKVFLKNLFLLDHHYFLDSQTGSFRVNK